MRAFRIAWGRTPNGNGRGIGSAGGQLRRYFVRLQEPCCAVLVIVNQLFILSGAHVVRPNYSRGVDISSVVNPLVDAQSSCLCVRTGTEVIRLVAHQNEMTAGVTFEL